LIGAFIIVPLVAAAFLVAIPMGIAMLGMMIYIAYES
jgi:hypothetical protein